MDLGQGGSKSEHWAGQPHSNDLGPMATRFVMNPLAPCCIRGGPTPAKRHARAHRVRGHRANRLVRLRYRKDEAVRTFAPQVVFSSFTRGTPRGLLGNSGSMTFHSKSVSL